MTSPLLRQLDAFCRQYPVARKYIFVPGPQVGYNLGGALALGGRGWVNLALVTPADHARVLVGPTLMGEGYRPMNEDARLLLVERLVNELLDGIPGNYFADVPRSSGLARAFRGTLQSLRMSGVSPDDVEAQLATRKGRFIAAAYRRYVQMLESQRVLDDALVFSRAIEFAGRAPLPPAAYAILDETPVPGLAGAYVEAVAGESMHRLGIDGIDASPAPHVAATRFARVPRLAAVEAPTSAVALRTCVGSENEVRAVLRTVLGAGHSFDSVEIAYGGERPYLARLVDLADRFDVPVAFGAGIPAMLTRPGQAVVGFLRWIASGYGAKELVDLARGGLLDPILPRDGERALRGYELARRIRRARIVGGRLQYVRQLQRRVEESRRGAGSAEAMSLRAVEALLDLVDEQAEVSIAGLAHSSSAFLDRFARVSTPRDRVAIESLADRLAKIREADPEGTPHPAAAARLVEMLQEHKIEASTAREGALYAVPLARAGYSGRAHLFVVGLDESTFPGSPIEDPVLLDDERRRLSPELTLLRSGPGEQVWQLKRVLRSGARQAVLFAQRNGIHDARAVFPSAFFQELAETNPPVDLPLVPPRNTALEASESYLALDATPGLRLALDDAYPHLAGGYRARAARADGFTAFRGYLGERVPDALVPGVGAPTSASGLEHFVVCPYRYFLRSVLRVRPPDDDEPDPAIWLTGREIGIALHEACRRFMVTLQERGERPDVGRHAALMDAIVDAVVRETTDDVPVHNEAAFKADLARLHRAGQMFLADESRREAEPLAFELSFGEGVNGGLNAPDPVLVPLTDGLRLSLKGRIDRVDRVDGGFEIWDYKSGAPSSYEETDLLGGGRNLQWALYAHALNALLESRGETGEVVRSGYFFVGDRGHGLRYADAAPTGGHLASLLEPLLHMAGEGAFPHLHKHKNTCRYCDFRHVCESEAQHCKKLSGAVKAEPSLVPEDLPYREALLRWIEVEE